MPMSGMGHGFNHHCHLDLDHAPADVLARRFMHCVPETTDTHNSASLLVMDVCLIYLRDGCKYRMM